jgi:hypothetical protein
LQGRISDRPPVSGQHFKEFNKKAARNGGFSRFLLELFENDA